MVLAALESAGIHVPRLCHDNRIAPVGACRLCLVRVEGVARPVASCVTPLADGMVIETHTPRARGRTAHAARDAGRAPAERGRGGRHRDAVPPRAARLWPHLRAHRQGRSEPGRQSTSAHPRRHVPLHRLLSLRAHLRRAAGAVHLAGDRNRGADPRIVPDSGDDAPRELLRELRRVRRRLPDGRARGQVAPHARRRRRAGPARPAPIAASAARCRSARATGGSSTSGRPSTRRSARGTCARKGDTPSSSSTRADRVTAPMIRESGALATGLLGRGASRHVADRLRRDRRDSTGRTRSACSARRAPPTRRTTSSRSSPGWRSAPTTSTAARASATRRARRRSRPCSAPARRRTRSTTSSGPRPSSYAAATRPRAIPIVGARIRQAALPGRQAHRASTRAGPSWRRSPTSISRRARDRTARSSTPWRT